MTGDYGAFVLACDSLIKSEVRRLARRGVSLDVDDGYQEGMRILLEEEETITANPDPALVRTIVRRRLCSVFVQRPMASKRLGTMVSADELSAGTEDAADDVGVAAADSLSRSGPVDQHTIECMSVESHENDVVDRVSFDEVSDFIGFCNAPEMTPAARHERRRRWLPKIQEFAARRAA